MPYISFQYNYYAGQGCCHTYVISDTINDLIKKNLDIFFELLDMNDYAWWTIIYSGSKKIEYDVEYNFEQLLENSHEKEYCFVKGDDYWNSKIKTQKYKDKMRNKITKQVTKSILKDLKGSEVVTTSINKYNKLLWNYDTDDSIPITTDQYKFKLTSITKNQYKLELESSICASFNLYVVDYIDD